jgi:ABC-type transport system substrate-binding protein
VLQGLNLPATGVVPSQVPGALAGPCDACVFDPERAKALFDGAGGVPGNSVVLYDIADDGQAAVDFIVNSWKDVLGLDVEVRSFEFAQFLEETSADRAAGPFELGWVWDYPSGYNILSPLFESTSDANNLSWSNARFDELMAEIRTASDETAALPLLGEAQRLVETELPLIPLGFANDTGVYSDRISGVTVDAGALWRLELVEVTG